MPKRLVPKRLGPKRIFTETTRGRNGLMPKHPVTKLYECLQIVSPLLFLENCTLKFTRNSMVQGLKQNTFFAIVQTILNVFALAYRTHKRTRQTANCSISSCKTFKHHLRRIKIVIVLSFLTPSQWMCINNGFWIYNIWKGTQYCVTLPRLRCKHGNNIKNHKTSSVFVVFLHLPATFINY